MAQYESRLYGVATTIDVDLYETDGASVKADATFAAGDVTVMKDEGTPANIGTLPTDEGRVYSFPLTATEMQAARIVVELIDQSDPKVWLDRVVIVETYGHASAQHEHFPVDVIEIGGSATVVAALKDLYDSAVQGTVDNATFTATTSSWESDDLAVEEDDFYEHRICLFTSGNLTGQTRPINASGTANGKVKLFVVETDAFTVAPADNDTFRLLGFGK
jgi:hypothetical protein